MNLKFIKNLEISAENTGINIDLLPRLLHCNGELVPFLLETGIYAYLDFQPLSKILFTGKDEENMVVPCSKEDVFANQEWSLVRKRKIMKLMTFLMSEQQQSELDDYISFDDYLRNHVPDEHSMQLIKTVLCQEEPSSAKHGISLLKRHFSSLGKYHKGPFIYSEYGTCSEIIQGCCRSAAVHGGITVLNSEYTINSEKVILIEGESIGRALWTLEPGTSTRTVYRAILIRKKTSNAFEPSVHFYSKNACGNNETVLQFVEQQGDFELIHFVSDGPMGSIVEKVKREDDEFVLFELLIPTEVLLNGKSFPIPSNIFNMEQDLASARCLFSELSIPENSQNTE